MRTDDNTEHKLYEITKIIYYNNEKSYRLILQQCDNKIQEKLNKGNKIKQTRTLMISAGRCLQNVILFVKH